MNFLAFGITEYIILAIALVVFILLIVWFFIFMRKKMLQRFSLLRYFYPVIRKTAVYYDFYLINQLQMQLVNNESLFIDHVIFGNKYIYIISDYLFKGVLTGKPQDAKWILTDKKGAEKMVDNPLLETKRLMQKLSLRTSLDYSNFIGVTLISKDTKITDLDVNDNQNFIIDTKDFTKLLLRIEGRDISPLNPEELKKRVHEIDGLNIRKTRGQKWPVKS